TAGRQDRARRRAGRRGDRPGHHAVPAAGRAGDPGRDGGPGRGAGRAAAGCAGTGCATAGCSTAGCAATGGAVTGAWVAVLVTAAGCYALKLTGLIVPRGV